MLLCPQSMLDSKALIRSRPDSGIAVSTSSASYSSSELHKERDIDEPDCNTSCQEMVEKVSKVCALNYLMLHRWWNKVSKDRALNYLMLHQLWNKVSKVLSLNFGSELMVEKVCKVRALYYLILHRWWNKVSKILALNFW